MAYATGTVDTLEAMGGGTVTTYPFEAEAGPEQAVRRRRQRRRHTRVELHQVEVADHDNRGAGGDGGPERDQVTSIELRLSHRLNRQPLVAVAGHRAVAREVLEDRDGAALQQPGRRGAHRAGGLLQGGTVPV